MKVGIFKLRLRKSLARENFQKNVPQVKHDCMLVEFLLILCWCVKLTNCECFGNVTDCNFTQDRTSRICSEAAYFAQLVIHSFQNGGGNANCL